MADENVIHHKVELSIWPLVVGISSLIIPFAFMTHFSWGMSFIGLFLAGIAVAGLLIGLFGWLSEIYSNDQDVGLSSIAIMMFIVSEVMLFGGMFAGYFYNMFPAEVWPPANTPAGVPPLGLALILSVFLISSSATIHVAETKLQEGDNSGFVKWLIITMILAILFISGQAREWSHLMGQDFTISTNSFGTFFYSITGFHGSHVVIGIIMQIFVLLMALQKRLTKKKHTIMKATGYYWHFVDVIWLLVLGLIYVIPYRG